MPTARLFLATVLILVAAPAGADTLTATLGQPLREVSHGVDARLGHGGVTYTVRRSFANTGQRHEEAHLLISLPPGAAATGLRIRAAGRWYDGELLEAALAAALYRKLTGIGPHEPKDPAILLWVAHDELSLRIFPVPPGKTSTVEYTLTAPTSYANGRHQLAYTVPARGSPLATPVVRLHPGSPAATVTLDGKLVAAAQPLILTRKQAPGQHQLASFTVSPPRICTLAARLGRVVAGPGKQYSRLEVDVAPRLGAVPKQPNVVFVLDASHSMGPRGLEAELSLMRSFWSHVPDARVEVVLYRRKAVRLFSGFVGLARAEELLAAAGAEGKLWPGNGSNLDAGLRLGVAALDGAVRARGRRRPASRGYLVMLGDGLLRLSFTNRPSLRVLSRAPRGTVSHVVLASPGSHLHEQRDDSHALSSLASARGGVLLSVSGISGDAAARVPLRGVTEGLVRPVRLDHFKIKGYAGEGLEKIPPILREGRGLREMIRLPAAPRRLVLSGKLWARTFSRVVPATRAFSRVTAALVFAEGEISDLEPKEMMRVARLGRVVSPVTSYLAIEPGVRPSTEGLSRLMGSEVGEAYGVGGLGLVGTGSGGGGASKDMGDLVSAAVSRCVRAHKPAPGWSATLSVETTIHEIVDVSLTSSLPAPIKSCIVEGTWRVRLPSYYDEAHQVYKVPLSG